MHEYRLLVKGRSAKNTALTKERLFQRHQVVIRRNFKAEKPDQKWLPNMTAFSTPVGNVFISPIIACYGDMPVAWITDTHLSSTILDCVICSLSHDAHPILHFDRDCHYRWASWIKRIDSAGLTRSTSMSREGYSPDNSACEELRRGIKNKMFHCRS